MDWLLEMLFSWNSEWPTRITCSIEWHVFNVYLHLNLNFCRNWFVMLCSSFWRILKSSGSRNVVETVDMALLLPDSVETTQLSLTLMQFIRRFKQVFKFFRVFSIEYSFRHFLLLSYFQFKYDIQCLSSLTYMTFWKLKKKTKIPERNIIFYSYNCEYVPLGYFFIQLPKVYHLSSLFLSSELCEEFHFDNISSKHSLFFYSLLSYYSFNLVSYFNV